MKKIIVAVLIFLISVNLLAEWIQTNEETTGFFSFWKELEKKTFIFTNILSIIDL